MAVSGPDGDRCAVVRFDDSPAGPTVADLAARAGFDPGGALVVDGRPVGPDIPLGQAGLADGSLLEAVPADDALTPSGWALAVIAGPGTGGVRPLPTGASLLGTGPAADIRLDDDPAEQPVTLHLDADGTSTVVDEEGARSVPAGHPVSVGRRTLAVTGCRRPPTPPLSGTTIPIRPVVGVDVSPSPAPPAPATPGPPPVGPAFSWTGLLAPLAVGAVMAVLWSPRIALFSALGPVIVMGTWVEQRRRHRRDLAAHRADLEHRGQEHQDAVEDHERAEATLVRRRLPAIDVLAERASSGGGGLWAAPDPVTVSVGWSGGRPVPVTLPGRTVVLLGPDPVSEGVLAHLVVQAAVAHGPSTLTIDHHPEGAGAPGWLGWLPHQGRTPATDPRPFGLATFGRGVLPDRPPAPDQAHLVVVSPGAPTPPWADATVRVGADGGGELERHDQGLDARATTSMRTAPLDPADAGRISRHLARWREITDGPIDLDGIDAVTLDRLVGPLDDVATVLDRWEAAVGTGALPAPIGIGPAGRVEVDLVGHGPHAVIGGTTGSGKSQLLRTLVASLAANHPPERVAFVLVDYKGGSTFDGCAPLPHVATVVTDLDGTRTDRVLAGVDAELTRRERWLRDRGRADLDAAADQPDRPPRLVVIIDEFATLIQDRPDVVPSLVDVARRGRSLGLHLVLATQRPAGAMSDDIRANTDLRIALRTADPADSSDVIGVTDAARIPADRPGRAILRRAGSTTEVLQVAAATSTAITGVGLDVLWVEAPARPRSGETVPSRPGPTAIEQLVRAATAAVARSHRRGAAPLWPPELPPVLTPQDAEDAVASASAPAGPDDADPRVTIGLVDDLEATRHRPCHWSPDRGILALHGSHEADLGGVVTGVTVAAHRRQRGLQVYAVDGTGELGRWSEADPVASVAGAGHRDGVRRLAARLERVLSPRSPTRPAPAVLVVIHDHPAIARALDDLDGLRLLDRLHRLAAEGPALGVEVVITSPRPGVLPPSIAGAVHRRMVLHLAQPDDYRLAGLRPPVATLPPGRGLDEHGVPVQLVRLDPSQLTGHTTTPPAERPRPLGELPTCVTHRPEPVDRTAAPWLLPLGVDHDGGAALALPPDRPTVVAGPPGSGRTTTLRTLALEARRRNSRVLTLVAEGGQRLSHDAPPVLVHDLERLIAEAAADRTQVLLLVDDATEVADDDAVLARLARGRLRPDGFRLAVALDPVERRTTYGHWTAGLRRLRCGVALQHDADEDHDLWAGPLPPVTAGRRPPGRGLLLREGTEAVEIQVALP